MVEPLPGEIPFRELSFQHPALLAVNKVVVHARSGMEHSSPETGSLPGLGDQGIVPRILVVDDELDTLELIGFNLIGSGFEVGIAVQGNEALYKIQISPPDLVVLDLTLPDMDGFEICERLRSAPQTCEIPILILTARTTEMDRVRGFELGANDYLTKPFSPRELLLRIRNLLSARRDRNDRNIIRMGNLCIDIASHSVTVSGKAVSLTLTEFRLLTTLVQQNGRVQTRESLLAQAWQDQPEVHPRTVDRHMSRLREKLGRASFEVDTVYGVGYRVIYGESDHG